MANPMAVPHQCNHGERWGNWRLATPASNVLLTWTWEACKLSPLLSPCEDWSLFCACLLIWIKRLHTIDTLSSSMTNSSSDTAGRDGSTVWQPWWRWSWAKCSWTASACTILLFLTSELLVSIFRLVKVVTVGGTSVLNISTIEFWPATIGLDNSSMMGFVG